MKRVQELPVLFIITILSYLLAVMTVNLSSFPGLHADEAWVGLNANNIIYNGVRSIHGVNTYTSSLYSALVALGFMKFGVHLFTLRFVGVFLNLLSFAIVAFSYYKYVDKKATFLYLALLLSCSSLLLFPRIAWEVCALQGFFLSIKFSILLKYFKGDKLNFVDVFAFFTLTSIGIINHFIFIFESLGFSLAALFLHLRYRDKATLELLYFSIFPVGLAAIIYFIKPPISEEIFQTYGYALLFLAITILAMASLLFIHTRFRIQELVDRSIAKVFYAIALISGIAVVFFLLSKFYALHTWSFFGTLSGIVVIERLSSYLLSSAEERWLEIAWGIILGIFLVRGFQKLLQFKNTTNTIQGEVFFYLYTLCSLLCISLSPGNSDRYYIIPVYLFAASFPLVVRNHGIIGKTRYFWGILLVILSSTLALEHSLLWRNIAELYNRPPVVVTYYNYRDRSSHFLKHNELLAFLRERKLCQIHIDTTFFIYFPLDFHFLTNRIPCDRTRTARIEYCPHCLGEPKYFKIIESTDKS